MPNPCEIVNDVGHGNERAFPGLSIALFAAVAALETLTLTTAISVSDSAQAAETVAPHGYTLINDAAQARDTLSATSASIYLARDTGDGRDRLRLTLVENIQDDAQASETTTFLPAYLLADAGSTGDAVTPSATASLILRDNGHATGTYTRRTMATLTDGGEADETVYAGATQGDAIHDAASAADALTERAVSRITARDAAHGRATLLAGQSSAVTIRDQATAYGAALLPSLGTGWTCNTDTFAMSQYDPFAYRDPVVIDGVLYAIGDNGLVAFDGDDDEGKAFDTLIRWGLQDFGAEQLKRPSYAYVGYQSGAPMIMRVGHVSAGTEQTLEYSLPARIAVDAVPGRFRLGRGIRSRYYRFSFEGAPGAPFTLHAMNVNLDTTSRRI